MKRPEVIVLEFDGWLAKQLRELVAENRWLLHATRTAAAARTQALDRRPAVLLVQLEPGSEKSDAFDLIADIHASAPDVPVIAVSDVKFPDPERAAWTAVLLDLGARYVLFPPLMKPVLEDVVSGLMIGAIRLTAGDSPPPTEKGREDEVIDLARGDAEA